MLFSFAQFSNKTLQWWLLKDMESSFNIVLDTRCKETKEGDFRLLLRIYQLRTLSSKKKVIIGVALNRIPSLIRIHSHVSGSINNAEHSGEPKANCCSSVFERLTFRV